MKYGSFEAHPAMFDEHEGWVLFGTTSKDWRELPLTEVRGNTGLMSEAKFKETYGRLPELPKAAFSR